VAFGLAIVTGIGAATRSAGTDLVDGIPQRGTVLGAQAAEATRLNVPGTPWFFVKIGTAAPKVVRPDAYDGESFAKLLDDALGR